MSKLALTTDVNGKSHIQRRSLVYITNQIRLESVEFRWAISIVFKVHKSMDSHVN